MPYASKYISIFLTLSRALKPVSKIVGLSLLVLVLIFGSSVFVSSSATTSSLKANLWRAIFVQNSEPEQEPNPAALVIPAAEAPEPEKPASRVPDAIEILVLMNEKTINLNQAAAHFAVDKEALRAVINTPGSGIVVGRGGYLNVATTG